MTGSGKNHSTRRRNQGLVLVRRLLGKLERVALQLIPPGASQKGPLATSLALLHRHYWAGAFRSPLYDVSLTRHDRESPVKGAS